MGITKANERILLAVGAFLLAVVVLVLAPSVALADEESMSPTNEPDVSLAGDQGMALTTQSEELLVTQDSQIQTSSPKTGCRLLSCA